jgi:hypothetical protein
MKPATVCFLSAALLLAGCTAPPPPAPPAPPAPQPVATPAPPLERGTILAMHPIPAEPPETARILLSGLGGTPAPRHADSFEFIVRAPGGATIAVVQPETDGLRPGAPVAILRGGRTSLLAAQADAASPSP